MIRLPARPSLLGALLLLLSTASALAAPDLDWDRSAGALLLRFEERSDKLAVADPLRLELWGDGRLELVLPATHPRAGVLEGRLDAMELESFLRALLSPELSRFDAAEVRASLLAEAEERRRRAAAGGERPPLVYRSERELLRLELRIRKYRAAPSQPPREVELEIDWRGLRRDLDEFSGNKSLEALSDALAACRELAAEIAEVGP